MRMLLLMSLTTLIYPMDDFLLTVIPASLAGFVAFSAGREQQRREETELRSDNLTILTHEFDQLKRTLDSQGMLVKGTPEIRICNPINTLFNRAIEGNNESALEMILNLLPSFAINGLDESGSTALQIAGRCKNAHLVEYLLKKGARPDVPDKSGITPFHYAVYESDTETLSPMLKADPNLIALELDATGSTALHVAAQQKNKSLLSLFLELHANPNLRNLEGKTPLHHAAQAGDPDIIASLIGADAQPNVADAGGMTPLHYAALTGNTGAIELLIKAGAEPNMPNSKGESAATIAFNTNLHDTLRFLLALKRAPTLTDSESPSDFLVNIIGLIKPTIEKLQKTASSSRTSGNESAHLVMHTLLERDPDCSICFESLPADVVQIASCCGKAVCSICVTGLLNGPKHSCAFCQNPLPDDPFFSYNRQAIEEATDASRDSDHQEASSST